MSHTQAPQGPTLCLPAECHNSRCCQCHSLLQDARMLFVTVLSPAHNPGPGSCSHIQPTAGGGQWTTVGVMKAGTTSHTNGAVASVWMVIVDYTKLWVAVWTENCTWPYL